MYGFRRSSRLGGLVVMALVLAACGGGGGGGGTAKSTSAVPASNQTASAVPTPRNGAPVVSGSPETDATAGSTYTFQPTAYDPDGDSIEYRIENKPAWAAFDIRSGRLSGTPSDADVGSYSNIVISVSDGKASTTLGPFTITVSQVQLGAATLTWLPPTENTDGSPIADLAGYRIRYGRQAGELTELQSIPNPGITSAVVENLASGTWYFTVSAYNTSGVESEYSNLAQKTIL
jgi:hypothetical protein